MLHRAGTTLGAGWGLDFTWPFLLRYPRRRVAVIDDACMVHSAAQGSKRGAEGDLYAVPVPYDEREEESRRVAEYGYYPSRVEAMGLPCVVQRLQRLATSAVHGFDSVLSGMQGEGGRQTSWNGRT
jgi:hypothetical protein